MFTVDFFSYSTKYYEINLMKQKLSQYLSISLYNTQWHLHQHTHKHARMHTRMCILESWISGEECVLFFQDWNPVPLSGNSQFPANSSPGVPETLFWFLQALHSHAQTHTHIHTIKSKNEFKLISSKRESIGFMHLEVRVTSFLGDWM